MVLRSSGISTRTRICLRRRQGNDGNFINSLHPPAPQRRAQPLVSEDQGQVDLLQVHRPADRQGQVAMSVDMQQLQAIHLLQGEVSEADREVKTFVEDYEQQLADLPEQQAVDEAEQALKEARDRLKITIAS